MDYYRPVTAHVPLRPMGASPDGLGAYFETKYTQGISPNPGGVFPVAYKPITHRSTQGLGNGVNVEGGQSSIAVYHPIIREAANGLGCGCAAPASGVGGEVYPMPAWLSSTWVKVGLGAAVLGALWFAFGRKKKQTANARRRHRRNAKWSNAYKNRLPDSAFLLVQPGGSAMIEHGHKVTIPRRLRKFPYRNRDGSVNLPHLRNAIARIPQANLSQSLKTSLQAQARSVLTAHGGYARARKAGGALKAAA